MLCNSKLGTTFSFLGVLFFLHIPRGFTEAGRRTLMLFLKMYPGSEKPFFLSIGSLKMTSCSNRKTRLSLARDRKPLSCSVTVKVSCWSSLPWAVIFPCAETQPKHGGGWRAAVFDRLCEDDVPQSLVICQHSSCRCNVLAQSTSHQLLSGQNLKQASSVKRVNL